MESLRKEDETGSDCPRMPAVSESASQYMTIFNQMAKFTNINPSKKHIGWASASRYQYQTWFNFNHWMFKTRKAPDKSIRELELLAIYNRCCVSSFQQCHFAEIS